MRVIIYILTFCLSFLTLIESLGQNIASDNFENNGLSRWENIGNWTIDSLHPISGYKSLCHNIFATSGTSYANFPIGTHRIEDGAYRWDFTVKNGDWQLSDSEKWFFVLASDNQNIEDANGYIIGVNIFSSDNRLNLYQLTQGAPTKLIVRTDVEWKGLQTYQVQVRSEHGKWELKLRERPNGNWSKTFVGDNFGKVYSFNNLGVFFKFSASHGGQLWFDDLSLDFEKLPPVMVSVLAVKNDEYKIVFSGNILIDDNFTEKSNYQVTSITGKTIPIISVRKAESDSTVVYFTVGPNAELNLHLSTKNLKDREGNALSNPEIDFSAIEIFENSTLVLNEIMADPTPTVGLPSEEYIEIFNNSNQPIDTENWSLNVNNSLKILPPAIIDPGGFLLITGNGGASMLQSFGNVVELSGFSINNESAEITLISNNSLMLDQLNYRVSLHTKGHEKGGYSLERIDPNRKCGQDENWATSINNNGGTPGTTNSIRADNPDNKVFKIVSTKMKTERVLDVKLNKIPDLSLAFDKIFKLPLAINTIDSIIFDQANLTIELFFAENSLQNGQSYQLTIENLRDECGNLVQTETFDFGYFIPRKGDLFLSEILFSPLPNCAEFVEIYNKSDKTIDLSEIFMATRDAKMELANINPITSITSEIAPAEYVALTKNPENILQTYTSKCPGCVILSSKLPALKDGSGYVVLLNKKMEIIDEFHYTEAYHSPLITSIKGISLERTSFDIDTNEAKNWHSASKSVGFATPGYKNSSATLPVTEDIPVLIRQQYFSPNNDGYNDVFEILLNPGEPGWIINVKIYNSLGIEVRRLANNLAISSEDIIEWNGLKEDFRKAELGIYIVQIELFNENGRTKSFKIPCAVTDKL